MLLHDGHLLASLVSVLMVGQANSVLCVVGGGALLGCVDVVGGLLLGDHVPVVGGVPGGLVLDLVHDLGGGTG